MGETVIAAVAEVVINKKRRFLHASMPIFFHGVVNGWHCISVPSQSYFEEFIAPINIRNTETEPSCLLRHEIEPEGNKVSAVFY